MAGFIEDFYYGNIKTQNYTPELGNELKKKLGGLTSLENQFSDRLTGEEKELFLSYVEKYNEFNSLSVADSFINAFRLSSKFTYDSLSDNLLLSFRGSWHKMLRRKSLRSICVLFYKIVFYY